jgi:hypothetical protein
MRAALFGSPFWNQGPLEPVTDLELVFGRPRGIDFSARTTILPVADLGQSDRGVRPVLVLHHNGFGLALGLEAVQPMARDILALTILLTSPTARRRAHRCAEDLIVAVTQIVPQHPAEHTTEDHPCGRRVDFALPRLVSRTRTARPNQTDNRYQRQHRTEPYLILHRTLPSYL